MHNVFQPPPPLLPPSPSFPFLFLSFHPMSFVWRGTGGGGGGGGDGGEWRDGEKERGDEPLFFVPLLLFFFFFFKERERPVCNSVLSIVLTRPAEW